MTKFYFTSTIYHERFNEPNEVVKRWFDDNHTIEQMLSFYEMEKNEPRGYDLISWDWSARHYFNRTINSESWEFERFDNECNILSSFKLVAFYNWED